MISLRKYKMLLSLPEKRALLLSLASLLALTSNAIAGPREQALQIHNRVAGIPPSETVLIQMAQDIAAGRVSDAVDTAMDNESFYSATLKNLATPWTNREQTAFAPLNDYTATVIGMARDNIDFRTLLYGNILYTVNGVSTPYANNSNQHYEDAQNQAIPLKTGLTQRTQSEVTGLPAGAVSGVITSRAAARAFFIDGTNRAMFRFTLMNHLCRDLEQVHDVTRVPDFIRQDVSRSPGGDSRVFLNSCMGCHNGMDPMAKAYAYYDFEYATPAADASEAEVLRLKGEGSLHYNQTNDVYKVTKGGVLVTESGDTRVEHKYLQNENTFKQGYITTDNSWKNYWRAGVNKHLGWDFGNEGVPAQGDDLAGMNKELAHSKAFASCQVEKVFENVCLRTPASDTDLTKIEEFTNSFAGSGFKLKQIFRDTAEYCMGQ